MILHIHVLYSVIVIFIHVNLQYLYIWLPTQYFALLTCRKIFFKMNKNAALSNLRNEILKNTQIEKKKLRRGYDGGGLKKKVVNKKSKKKGVMLKIFFLSLDLLPV